MTRGCAFYMVMITTFGCFFSSTSAFPFSYNNSTEMTNPYDLDNSQKYQGIRQSIHQECKLFLLNPSQWDDVQNSLNDGVRVITFKFQFNQGLNETAAGDAFGVFQYYTWTKVRDERAKNVLILKTQFKTLSLRFFIQSIHNVELSVEPQPKFCFKNLMVAEFEMVVIEFLYDMYQTKTFKDLESICYQQQRTGPNTKVSSASFVCCQRDNDGVMECSHTPWTKWIKFLMQIFIFFQFFVLMYIPAVLPEAWCQIKNTYSEYTVGMDQDADIFLCIKRLHKNDDLSGWQKATISRFCSFDVLKSAVSEMQRGEVQKMGVKEVKIRVKKNAILTDNYAPVGLASVLYNFLVKCKTWNTSKSIRRCCYSNALVICSGRQLYWYKCLSTVVKIIVCLTALVPWFLRCLVHVKYGESQHEGPSPFINVGGLTANLSPFNPLFIVIYWTIPLVILILKCFPDSLKNKLKFIMKECFRLERETSRASICTSLFDILVYPLEKLGILGFPLFPLWLIVVFFVTPFVLLSLLPTINLTFRLMINFGYSLLKILANKTLLNRRRNKSVCDRFQRFIKGTLVFEESAEKVHRKDHIMHCIAIILSIFLILCVVVFLTECISFLSELVMFVIIKTIINPNSTVHTSSLAVLVIVYAHQCFSEVGTRHMKFNQSLHDEVIGLVENEVLEVAKLPKVDQINAGFVVKSERGHEEKLEFVRGKHGSLKWRARRLLLFLDNEDTPYISRKFFYKLSVLNHVGCPGEVHFQYIRAGCMFVILLVFLLFVFIATKAFGDAQKISAWHKSLATLIGGFIPLIVRKCLYTSSNSPNWRILFNNQAHQYCEDWVCTDIKLVPDPRKAQRNAVLYASSEAQTEDNESSVELQGNKVDIETEHDHEINKVNLMIKCEETGLEVYLPTENEISFYDLTSTI